VTTFSRFLSSFSIFFSREYLLVANLGERGPVLRYDLASGRFVDAFISVERPDPQYGNITAAPYDLQRSPDGWLHALVLNPREVWRFRQGTGGFVNVVVPNLQKKDNWRQAFCLAFGPDGDLYLSTNAGKLPSEVLRFDSNTGAPKGMFIPTGSGGLQGDNCILFGPDGNFYAAGSDLPGILRFNGTTGAFRDVFVPSYPHGNFVNPRSLAFGPDGDLYAIATAPGQPSENATDPDRIVRYDGVTGALLGEFIAPNAEMGRPISMAFGPEGNLYVGVTYQVGEHGTSSLYTGRIRVYQGTTGAFLGALDPANHAKLDYPISLTFARVPVSVRDIIFISRIPRWMWVLGLGALLGLIVGRNQQVERR
jgi:hypothetical protein